MSLASGLCERILAKTRSGSSKIPSKSCLAKEFGVSPATVSNAIRLLKDGGSLRSVPGKGVYLASAAPGKASRKKRGAGLLIGLAGCYLPSGDSFASDGVQALDYNPVISGVWAAAREAGATLAMVPGGPGSIDLQLVRRLKLDGVIVAGGTPFAELLKLRRMPVPLVLSNYPAVPASPFSFADFDNAWMLEDAVRRFKDRGCSRIAFVGQREYSVPGYGAWLKERFMIALAKAGLQWFPELWMESSSPSVRPLSESEAESLLSLRSPPDAAFCWSPSWAASLVSAAKAKGLKAPRDLSLAVCSNSGEPGFSFYRQPCERLGRLLFEFLADSANDPSAFLSEFLRPSFNDRRSV